MKILIAAAILLLSFTSEAQSLRVKAEKVKISFLADMDKTEGTIGGFMAKINFNMDDLKNSTIQGSVEARTINTGSKQRDKHLKTADFFEVETYPIMTFTSTKIEQKGDKYIMTGMMKIKDVEHEETITFSYADQMFKGTGTIQLSNYNVGDYAKKGPDKTNIKISFGIPVE